MRGDICRHDRDAILAKLDLLVRRTGLIMGAQQDINKIVTEILAATTEIKTELAAKGVDTSGLDTAVAALQALADANATTASVTTTTTAPSTATTTVSTSATASTAHVEGERRADGLL